MSTETEMAPLTAAGLSGTKIPAIRHECLECRQKAMPTMTGKHTTDWVLRFMIWGYLRKRINCGMLTPASPFVPACYRSICIASYCRRETIRPSVVSMLY